MSRIQVSKKTIQLRLPAPLFERIDIAARSAGIPKTAWVTMAVNSYLSRWKSPVHVSEVRQVQESPDWPSGWPRKEKCFYSGCGSAKPHDPLSHGIIDQVDVDSFIKDLGEVEDD